MISTRALQCSYCGNVTQQKYETLPKTCAKCKRYYTSEHSVKIIEVPDDFFEKNPIGMKMVKPTAMPEGFSLVCSRCGQDFTKGAIVNKQYLCANCVLQTVLETEPKIASRRELRG